MKEERTTSEKERAVFGFHRFTILILQTYIALCLWHSHNKHAEKPFHNQPSPKITKIIKLLFNSIRMGGGAGRI
jgi:hypothetical protein